MSFATSYVTRETFNWMKVHLRIPRFNHIYFITSPAQYELLLDSNRFWDTPILISQNYLPHHPTFNNETLLDRRPNVGCPFCHHNWLFWDSKPQVAVFKSSILNTKPWLLPVMYAVIIGHKPPDCGCHPPECTTSQWNGVYRSDLLCRDGHWPA